MFGLPPDPGAILPETSSDAGTLVPSISITREPVGNEPFIQISYEVSMRVFTIAFLLSRLEQKAAQRASAQENAAEKETEDAKAEAAGKDTVTEQDSEGRTTIRSLKDKKKSGDNAAPDH